MNNLTLVEMETESVLNHLAKLKQAKKLVIEINSIDLQAIEIECALSGNSSKSPLKKFT